ncbi:hypothetical protein CLOM_g7079 [Closterium sp. NIES-68]|nr:hypothetical protein CLOM_g7079 [Closterium sp. NIES-68]
MGKSLGIPDLGTKIQPRDELLPAVQSSPAGRLFDDSGSLSALGDTSGRHSGLPGKTGGASRECQGVGVVLNASVDTSPSRREADTLDRFSVGFTPILVRSSAAPDTLDVVLRPESINGEEGQGGERQCADVPAFSSRSESTGGAGEAGGNGSSSSVTSISSSGSAAKSTSSDLTKGRKRVVVLGSGWGAVSFLKAIDARAYDVTIISPRNFFLFTPLLPSVTTGVVEGRSIAEPIRRILWRHGSTARFLEAECTAIDPDSKTLSCRAPANLPPPLPVRTKPTVGGGEEVEKEGAVQLLVQMVLLVVLLVVMLRVRRDERGLCV